MNHISSWLHHKSGFFIEWHINFPWLFNPKAILGEEQYWYDLTNSRGNKRIHAFPMGISPKVKVITRLNFELAYYDGVF